MKKSDNFREFLARAKKEKLIRGKNGYPEFGTPVFSFDFGNCGIVEVEATNLPAATAVWRKVFGSVAILSDMRLVKEKKCRCFFSEAIVNGNNRSVSLFEYALRGRN